MNKIPSTEEFLSNHMEIRYFYDDKTNQMVCFADDVQKAMNEFAQIHTKYIVEYKLLDLTNPWPLKDVLNKLIEATEILLHQKNYDGHGWEEISHCVQRGKEIINNLDNTIQQ